MNFGVNLSYALYYARAIDLDKNIDESVTSLP